MWAVPADHVTVSIRAPVKGRPLATLHHQHRLSFDPRPREGATATVAVKPRVVNVSIRAPVKGRLALSDRLARRTAFRSAPP